MLRTLLKNLKCSVDVWIYQQYLSLTLCSNRQTVSIDVTSLTQNSFAVAGGTLSWKESFRCESWLLFRHPSPSAVEEVPHCKKKISRILLGELVLVHFPKSRSYSLVCLDITPGCKENSRISSEAEWLQFRYTAYAGFPMTSHASWLSVMYVKTGFMAGERDWHWWGILKQ